MVSATSLILAGDVMTGRGIDQILASPGSPRLREEYVVDARSYVDLAEDVNGPIPEPVADAWPWGDALAAMDEVGPAVRVMNLETSVTRSEEVAPGKGVLYRMNPANLPCLAAARIDCCGLANNHVLDWGRAGLEGRTMDETHDRPEAPRYPQGVCELHAGTATNGARRSLRIQSRQRFSVIRYSQDENFACPLNPGSARNARRNASWHTSRASSSRPITRKASA